jgi:ketosteroid isomerase-like protein
MERATAHYKDGEVIAFEGVAKQITPDLAYVVEVERYKAKVGGGHDLVPVSLRVTTIFRPEDGSWKILHRHADPITTPQTAESVIGT